MQLTQILWCIGEPRSLQSSHQLMSDPLLHIVQLGHRNHHWVPQTHANLNVSDYCQVAIVGDDSTDRPF